MKLSLEHILRGPGKTIRQTVDDFYQSTDFRSGKPRTQAQKRYELEAFCRTKMNFGGTYGDLPIRSLTYWDVDAAVVPKLDRPAACYALIRVLRALVRFAVKVQLLTSDPTFGVVLPPMNPNGFRAWTEEDIAIFEATYPIGTLERLAFALALYTGLRRQDLHGIGPQHVRNGVIHLSPEKTRMTTGVFLVLPVHPELAKVLALVPEGQSAFLLTPCQRRPFSAIYLTIWFGRACRAAGLPKGLCLHGLRKAACRRLAESGCSVHEIMSVSGHRTMQWVEHYTKSVEWTKLARRAMENLVRAFPTAHAA
jgi:integrase